MKPFATHLSTTRRRFLKRAAMASLVSPAVGWEGMTTAVSPTRRNADRSVMIPTLSVPWEQAQPIGPTAWKLTRDQLGKLPISDSGFSNFKDSLAAGKSLGPMTKPLYADFCEVQDKLGRWHLMGIELSPNIPGQPAFYHYVSDRLTEGYERLPSVSSNFPLPVRRDLTLNMCSPCVVWEDERTALMFYAHVISGASPAGVEMIYDASMRVLECTDGRFEKWVPRCDPEFQEENILFHETYCRDPEIIWDDKRCIYLMYYAVGVGWTDSEASCVLRVRSSPNLRTWSEPMTLMTPPLGHRAVESPFVLHKDGLYYLWISGFDWGRMSLYISEDPLNFGDPVHNRIMEQSGHAPEIVHSDGKYWMACAGIASKFGFPWGWHDLIGTYIQPLDWRPATEVELGKIVRM